MDKLKIQRINELARKAKTVGLSSDEKNEQILLRNEYIKAFRQDLKSSLDSIVVVGKDGNKTPLKKKDVTKH